MFIRIQLPALLCCTACLWLADGLSMQKVMSSQENSADVLFSFESDTAMPTKNEEMGNDVHKIGLHNQMSNKQESGRLPLFMIRFLRLFNLQRLVRDLETSVTSHVSCTACKFGVGLLQYYMALGRTQDEIAELATNFCIDLHIESERVCKGIVSAFKNEVLFVFDKIALDPNEVCNIIVGDTCGSKDKPGSNWTIELPHIPKPPVKPVPLPKTGSPVLKVLHISDTHVDLNYKEGANAECGEPLCCRIGDDTPSDPSKAAGIWGDYRKCDPPLRTLESMLSNIVKNHKVDYILWTGDLPPHDVWNQTRSDQIYILKQSTQLIKKYFPTTPVLPALGNHESAPVNSFPPPSIIGDNSIKWLYDELSLTWSNWLPTYTLPTIRKGAFYSILMSPGFRIISLNMNYCNNKNWWLLLNTTDPAQELQWLVYELQYAEIKGEKVHIIGHIPPGTEDCIKIWSFNYYRIINRYESTVASQFFGHTHADEFELFYDENNRTRATNIAYIGPSLTPYFGLNPGFRIYTIDGTYPNSTYAVLDHETYMMDLADANKYGTPQWIKLYSAKEAYKMQTLQPQDWSTLVELMQKDNSVFKRYYKYYHRASRVYPPCDPKCKIRLLCNMNSGRSHDPSLCSSLRKMDRKE